MQDIDRAAHASGLHMEFDLFSLPGSYPLQRARHLRKILANIIKRGATLDRWKTLRIASKSHYEARMILDLFKQGAVPLETLRVRVAESYSDPSITEKSRKNFAESLVALFNKSSRLRDFGMARFRSTSETVTGIYLSMKNLTRLGLVLCSIRKVDDIHLILSNNLQLEKIVFKEIRIEGGPGAKILTSSLPSISLPHLRVLHLTDTRSEWLLPDLPRIIHAPNLVTLDLNLGNWPSETESTALMGFLCNREHTLIAPTLRRLSIGLFRCDSEYFSRLFTMCPDLTHLEWTVEQNKTQSLILSHSPWLLPRLSYMRVAGATNVMPLGFILECTILERISAGLPLRVVEVEELAWYKMDEKVRTLLKTALVEVGPSEVGLMEDEEDTECSSEDEPEGIITSDWSFDGV